MQLLHRRILPLIVCLISAALTMPATGTPPHKLAGFTTSPHYNEQILDLTLDPDVIVHINAPPADAFDPKLPVRLVIFALPNGNTIDQTVGRQMTEGLDWHYDIQHIGAQTRVLRKTMTDCNIVVAYLQAAKRSWPHWRRSHDDANARIATIVQELRSRFQDMNCTVELTAHSGGGSFLFGFIESSEPIPEWVTRFIWLDANYGFEEETHGKKLAKWLQANPKNRLGAYAYDDRDVKFKGKPIVSKTGGTYRRTEDMKSFFGETFQLKKAKRDAFIRYRSPSNQLELILLRNPDKKILHTVMVERNGFIHAIALGTPWEEKVAPFWSERAYTEFVQPN